MRLALSLTCLALAGCVTVAEPPAPQGTAAPVPARLDTSVAAQNFASVVARVEPVAEQECRARTRGVNCDFQIVVDDRANQPPNAFQTLDKSGRPIIAFNTALINEARNTDELAFILGHEASHHIEQHIPKQQQTAAAGAALFGVLATLGGVDGRGVKVAQDVGATVGARSFSKDMELEADALGTLIAHNAGYDPRRGAEFFYRIPDPGDRFLGTHPPNDRRRQVVAEVAAGL